MWVLKDVGGYSTGEERAIRILQHTCRRGRSTRSQDFLRLANVVSGDIIANSSFPQLYIDGELVGGLDIVKEMVDNGEFDELVQANGQAAESA